MQSGGDGDPGHPVAPGRMMSALAMRIESC